MNPADFIERLSESVAHHPLLALLVAVAGGVLSTSVCPCTLPAGIGIVGYIGTSDPARGRDDHHRTRVRWRGALLSLAFFAGLVLTLTALGTVASVIGRLLTRWAQAFALGAAGLTLVAGVATLFGPAIRQRVPDPTVRQRGGAVGAFLYGVLYSIATITTSAGPLILLLTVSAAMGRPVYGFGLSLAYALGRGLPFLLLGLFAGQVGAWMDRASQARRGFEIVSGLALIALAVYFVRLSILL